ncbi:creatininase [Candidatus Vecturithrix granuli]|uniref:Creatininase n=1 Tax=Vecturithrix granuli TaxID=1499967 RepID=A0A081C9W9_VECG1|nr:creatininase [Candidatus Vecturithrix granuli]
MAGKDGIRNWLTTDYPGVVFEDTQVGRMKKALFDASDEEIDAILAEYGIPSESELGKPGCYLQNTVRAQVIENRRKNDIVFVPVGCTENHGMHTVSGLDTFMVTQIVEGVRRYTAKRGKPCSLAFPPLTYGSHPYHHLGMPGTVMLEEDVTRKIMMQVMLGLWNDGFRKQIWINNHGQLWVLESAIQEFQKKYQLPGIYRILDWHRGVREFFATEDRGGKFSTNFVHADESETAVALLTFPKGMVDMSKAVSTVGKGVSYLPGGHFDTSVDPYRRPHKWSEGQGHFAIELYGTPEGVVGDATAGTAEKAKRPIAAILKYLTLIHDEILEAFPSGKLPPADMVTHRDAKEMEPFLKEPQSEGWRPIYALKQLIGN